MNFPLLKILLLLLPVCLGFGCLNLEPQRDDSRYYSLVPSIKENSAVIVPVRVIGLQSVHMPDFLRQDRMCIRQNDESIKFLDSFLWAEMPVNAFSTLLSRGLSQSKTHSLCLPTPWPGTVDPTLFLSVQVTRWEGCANGTVALECAWQVRTAQSAEAPISGTFIARDIRWQLGRYETLQHALASAVEQLAANIQSALK
jgi:uncharacterized lipoprotein YmbA